MPPLRPWSHLQRHSRRLWSFLGVTPSCLLQNDPATCSFWASGRPAPWCCWIRDSRGWSRWGRNPGFIVFPVGEVWKVSRPLWACLLATSGVVTGFTIRTGSKELLEILRCVWAVSEIPSLKRPQFMLQAVKEPPVHLHPGEETCPSLAEFWVASNRSSQKFHGQDFWSSLSCCW